MIAGSYWSKLKDVDEFERGLHQSTNKLKVKKNRRKIIMNDQPIRINK